MKKRNRILLCLVTAGMITASNAHAGNEAASNDELTERIIRLEEKLKTGGLPEAWADRITLSGVLEVEAGYEKMDYAGAGSEDESSSDLALATASIGVDAKISDYLSGHIVLLWEEDETEPVDMDEGFMLLDGGDTLPLYLKAGKTYVPFGKFESNMISDPLTLELGETRETALETGFHAGGFHGAVYAFNGDMDIEGDENHIDNYGITAGFTMEKEGFALDVGVGWINNIFDSDGLTDLAEESAAEARELGFSLSLKERIQGIAAHGVITAGPVTLIGEYVAMLEDIEVSMADITPGTLAALGLGSAAKGEKLAAWNLEAGYGLELLGKETVFGVSFQGVTDAEEGFPENRYLGVINVGIMKNTSLAMEYRHDEYETDDSADTLTMQLAVTF
ncbi:MAG: LbtU family siderophore porin [Pseudomonadota bacterium]